MLSEYIISQGKRIGNYHIGAEISSSPTSSIFLAEHSLRVQHSLVIKLFHREQVSKQKRELFLQEVQLLKKIKHAHILPILDAGIFENVPYYVTPYATKGSLRNLLDSQSSQLLPIQESLAILRMVGQVLQYTHQMNILHGNLKPENILFSDTGDVLLTDFSVVSLQDTFDTEHDHNSSSFPYMAPEQFLGRMNKESDQYALGCIAYELLTGQVPFIATDYAGFKEKHTAEQAIAPTQHNLLLPVTCEKVILKALQKKSDHRYPSMKDFVTALSSSTSVQPRGVIPPRHAANMATSPPWLVTKKRNTETQHIDEPQEEQKGSELLSKRETAPLAIPMIQRHLEEDNKEDDQAKSHADEIGPDIQASSLFQPGGAHPQQETPVAHSSAGPGATLLTDTTDKVASIVAPVSHSNLVRHAPAGNKRVWGLAWATALGLLVVLLVITSSLLFFKLPSTHSPQSSPTAISHKHIPTAPPTPTHVLTPTATSTPTPEPTPVSKAAPTAISSPTATPTPIPFSVLNVTPSSFQLSQDCLKQGSHYTCTATLLLSQNYQGSLQWSASGSGANTNFSPPEGILSPGQQQTVTIFLPRACPLAGSISFSTKNSVTTIPWSC
ncbi:MAG: serine/threonine protein kinase [Chloroflexi bacterium]|nr:MAG: serine/threonine protein kinase [Chloroflexota bacterium]